MNRQETTIHSQKCRDQSAQTDLASDSGRPEQLERYSTSIRFNVFVLMMCWDIDIISKPRNGTS